MDESQNKACEQPEKHKRGARPIPLLGEMAHGFVSFQGSERGAQRTARGRWPGEEGAVSRGVFRACGRGGSPPYSKAERMAKMEHGQDIRERPYYTAREVSWYSGIQLPCFRMWIRRHGSDIIRQRVERRGAVYSFMNLVEAYVVGLLREKGMTMQAIRKAIDYLTEVHPDIPHPLANLKFLSTDGIHLYHDDARGGCYSANERGQYHIRLIVKDYLWRFKFGEDNLPVLFFPSKSGRTADNASDICINPDILCGQPVITGSRISVRMIADLFAAGESMDAIMQDYDLTQNQVQEAIRFFTLGKAS